MSVHIANEHELKVARHMLSDLKRNDPFGLAAQGEWQRQIHVFDEAVGVILHVTGAIKDTVNFPLKFLWDALPWWAWLAAAGGVFLYMGGGVWLKGRLAK
jgi:hypothetical protein